MWCPCFPKTIWKGLTSEQFPTLLQSILNELWSREEGRVCASCSLASSLQTHTYTKICVHITMISVLVIVWNCHTHSLYAVTESNTKHGLHYSFSVFTPMHTIFRAIELQLLLWWCRNEILLPGAGLACFLRISSSQQRWESRAGFVTAPSIRWQHCC